MTIRSTADAELLICPFSFDAPARWSAGHREKIQDGGPLLCGARECMAWETQGYADDDETELGYCRRLYPNGVEG